MIQAIEQMIRGWIHRSIRWYLRRCGGAFHVGPYGSFGNYVKLLSDEDYHWMKETLHIRQDMPIQVADQLFVWLEEFYPLQHRWDAYEGPGAGESYPYSYFRSVAKNKLRELIRRNMLKNLEGE